MADETDDEEQTEYEKETDAYTNGSIEDRRMRWYFPELPLKTRQVLWALSEAEWVEWESLARELNHKRHNPNWVPPALLWWQQECLDAMNKISPPENPAPVRKTFIN